MKSKVAAAFAVIALLTMPTLAQEGASGRELFEQAQTAYESEDYDRALELLEAAQKSVGANARISAMKIRIHYARKNFVAAKEELVRFRRLESSDALYNEMGQLSVRLEAEEDSSLIERITGLQPDLRRLEQMLSHQWRSRGGKKANFEVHVTNLSLEFYSDPRPGNTCKLYIMVDYEARRNGEKSRKNKRDYFVFSHGLRADDTLFFSNRPNSDLEGEPLTGWPFIAVKRAGEHLTGGGNSMSLYRRGKKRNIHASSAMVPLYIAQDFRPSYDAAYVEQTFRRIADICGMKFQII